MTVPWTHLSMVTQPFADFTWRHARRVAAQRGVDNANETAVAVVLEALLRKAAAGPGSARTIARTQAVNELTDYLPPALQPPPQTKALEAGPADRRTTDQAADDEHDQVDASVGGDDEHQDGGVSSAQGQEREGTVVGFGMFDPFADDDWRSGR